MAKDYGFIRVAAVSPRVHLANPSENAKEMVAAVRQLTGLSTKKADFVNGDAKNGVSLTKSADFVNGTSVIVFPELSVTGYTCADLFGQDALLDAAEAAVAQIAADTAAEAAALQGGADHAPLIVVGTPIRYANRLYNCAVLMKAGVIVGIVPKTYLPNSAEFYEMRWFESASQLGEGLKPIEYAGQKTQLGLHQLFKMGKAVIGVEICQDLWVPIPPCSYEALMGANLILNLSASNEALCKQDYRKLLVASTSARLSSAYVYASCGYGESTQDLVWGGSSMIYENGSLLAENERFSRETTYICADIDLDKLNGARAKNPNFKDFYTWQCDYPIVDVGKPADTDFEKTLLRYVEPHPFVPGGDQEALSARCREILSIQVLGLCQRLEHIGCKTAVIGISGGLDSTLALLVTALAFDKLGWDRSRIIGVTMPGFGTTKRTKSNADILMERLGVTRREISIVAASSQHLADIGHSLDNHDTTYENAQARERTQILMDLAGQEGGIVVGTGDLSELALGWCTYNGDHMSMYGVNASIPKTLVRTLVKWAADQHFADAHDVLMDIIDTPISPELLPPSEDGTIAQVTEDTVGPYELHDFFLYNVMRWGYHPGKVLMLAKHAFLKPSADGVGTYDEATIVKWLRTFYWRFCSQQFKRSCLPDGPKVGSVSLSPRGDWRMPSDVKSTLWLSELPDLKSTK